MSVTGVSGAFSSPSRGNYSGCVAWRQQGPQAQLVRNTTQVAVNPLALTPTFPPASPHQWGDRNQTSHNLLKAYRSGLENKVSKSCFHSIFVTAARMRRQDPGLCYLWAVWLGLRHEGLQTTGLWHPSLPFRLLLLFFFQRRYASLIFPRAGICGFTSNTCAQTCKHTKLEQQTCHSTSVKL